MKNFNVKFVTLVFIFLPMAGQSQYKPMLNNGSEWYHYYWFEASCNHKLVIEGDTVLDNKTYKKVTNQGDLCNFEYYTFVREDVTKKQVFLHYDDTTEIMIYDFSLQAGDSIKSNFMYYHFHLKVDSISTQLPQNNGNFNPPELNLSMPRVFYLSTVDCIFCKQVIWVEGIGNISNPFRSETPWADGNLGDALLCHYDETGFRDYHFVYIYEPEPCQGPIVSTEDIEINDKIKVYPNPFQDQLTFESTDSEIIIVSVEIYNSSGVLIKKDDILSSNTINTSEIRSGLLAVVFKTNRGKVIVKKMIKQ